MTVFPIQMQIDGNEAEGYLSIMEAGKQIPFEIRRTFVTYQTPEDVERGGHAHFETEMVLIAIQGSITVKTEDRSGFKSEIVLDDPSTGLYLPRLCWHTMRYTKNALQLVLASTRYDSRDYIRDYNAFASHCHQFRQ